MDEAEGNNCTPDEITSAAQEVTENLLPEKSKLSYKKAYDKFIAWRLENKVSSFSENVLLAYFKNIHATFKPSSLWVEYSKLKSTISIYNQTDISKYSKLLAFLKRSSEGYKPKKAQTFSPENLNNFINEAPDEKYLLTKVAVIFGIMGACRRQELHTIKLTNVTDTQDMLVVHVLNTKNRIDRTFTVTGKYYNICKKYLELRPNPCNNQNFFLRYFNGKCTPQNIGINSFGQMGKTVANYLKLPNPECYTGHCFRRTSATLLVDAGGDITALKRHGGWKSTTVAEGYIDNSIQSRKNVSNLLMTTIDINESAPSTSYECKPTESMNPSTSTRQDSMNVVNPLVITTANNEPPEETLRESEPPEIRNPSTSTTSEYVPESTNCHEFSLSQVIKQNADVNINTRTSSITPTVNISNNTIQNLHIHFHK